MQKCQRAIIGAEPLAATQATIVVSELSFNSYDSIRAELIGRNGNLVVAISRWKNTPSGHLKRTGAAFEFGAHRIADMAKIVSDVQRILTIPVVR